MSSIGTGYDLSASQFSPDGRVFQVEYAAKSVENSGTAVALRGSDGVVFAVEKIISSDLHEDNAGTRIFNVDVGIGLTMAGMLSDGRQLVSIARQEAKEYRMQYEDQIPMKQLNRQVANYMHAYTLSSAVRPFGASVMLSSWTEDDGPELYVIEPSGFTCGYFGWAIGKAKQAAKTDLEHLKLSQTPAIDLLKTAAEIIYKVHDSSKDKKFAVELSWVGAQTDGKHVILSPSDALYIEARDYGKNKAAENEDSDGEAEAAA